MLRTWAMPCRPPFGSDRRIRRRVAAGPRPRTAGPGSSSTRRRSVLTLSVSQERREDGFDAGAVRLVDPHAAAEPVAGLQVAVDAVVGDGEGHPRVGRQRRDGRACRRRPPGAAPGRPWPARQGSRPRPRTSGRAGPRSGRRSPASAGGRRGHASTPTGTPTPNSTGGGVCRAADRRRGRDGRGDGAAGRRPCRRPGPRRRCSRRRFAWSPPGSAEFAQVRERPNPTRHATAGGALSRGILEPSSLGRRENSRNRGRRNLAPNPHESAATRSHFACPPLPGR